jgi:hypothetical protein
MTDSNNKNSSIFTFLLVTFFIIVISLLFFKTNSKNAEEEEITEFAIPGQTEDGFEDGTYCAEVEYYNPNTGTRSPYELEVEVSGNQVVQINFGNGGWLDTDHFSPEDIDSDGQCTIVSDRNYEYTIQLVEKDGNCLQDDIPEEEEPEVLFSLQQCAQIYNMSKSELNKYMRDFNVGPNDQYTEEMCENMGDYIQEIRKLNQKWGKTQNEIKNGYITNITRRSAFGVTSQVVTIQKNGIVYQLEVRGSEECTMGTAIFDENNYDWQLVYIKQYPDRESYSGHYMRIIL